MAKITTTIESDASGNSDVILSSPDHSAIPSKDWKCAAGVYQLHPTDVCRPCTVQWTALPIISWVIPFIGHVGISTSDGEISDFSGPYSVTVGSLMCGPARRIWKLDVADRDTYDGAVHAGAICYARRMHKYAAESVP
jgi:hypothetical protein